MTPLPGLASLFYRLDPLVGLTAMLAAAWAALAGVEPIQKRQPADLIRPPGVREASFDTLCIRCNECVKVCLCVKNKGGEPH